MAPEVFQPDQSEVQWSAPLPAEEPAAEAQEAETEAPAGQPAAAAEGASEGREDRPGQVVLTEPPDADSVPLTPTQPKETKAADEPSGEPASEGLAFEVLYEAAKAGLTQDQIRALATPDAIRAAIAFKGGTTAKPAETAAGTETPTGKETPAEKPAEPPDLPAWDVEVPAELLDPDQYDEKQGKFLKSLVDQMKKRDDIYRANIAYSRQAASQPRGDDLATAQQMVSEMKFDQAVNSWIEKPEYAPYMEKLGVGWGEELDQAHFQARQQVAQVAAELYQRQVDQGRRPKLAEITRQAAGIAFPEIASKLGQKALVSKLAARPKIGKPSGVSGQEPGDPRLSAIEAVKAMQKAARG